MSTITQSADIEVINEELKWFSEMLSTRLKLFFSQSCEYNAVSEVPVPDHADKNTSYSKFILENGYRPPERILLILSLIPYLQPQLLDPLFCKNPDTGQLYTEFGVVTSGHSAGLLPTIETFCFLLASGSMELRISLLKFFSSGHSFFKKKFLALDTVSQNDFPLSAVITPSAEIVSLLLYGQDFAPSFSSTFPAKKITTKHTWADLVLENNVREQVDELNAWIVHGHALHHEWGLGNKIMPGHRSLFHGPSGTGKTLTATLVGQQNGMDVYRIDLSLVVSKYIGETEKNLSKIFDLAENRNWILFFDEADALFGKRTNVKDAHDRFANQEISFLLQRVEDYNGLVILATNFKTNIDEAFARRFQSVINFPMPKVAQREDLWRKMFSEKMKLSPDINISEIARSYEISGGSIINVVQYASLMALKRNTDTIIRADLIEGIKREFDKAGKAM